MSPLITALFTYTPLLFLSYHLLQILYRLTFHPLSAFPGPKLLAISRAYEFYWDVLHHGRFWTRLPLLHAKYGPIIRIGPDELHIQDPEFFKELFAFRPLDKYAMAARQFGLRKAMFGTEEYKTYVGRRKAFGDAFGKSKGLGLQGLVNGKIAKGVNKVKGESGGDLA